jgi:hypothetical protein
VFPLQIHRGNIVVSGEAWRLFRETHPERDFFDFWLEVSLNFSINSFSFVKMTVLLQRPEVLRASGSQPLSSMIGEHEFAYASDIVENGSGDPGHIVELSY